MIDKPTTDGPSLAELAAKREQELAAERADRRLPGSGKVQLDGHRAEIIQLLAETMLPVAEINVLLAQVGVQVNVKTLFRYLRDELPAEYEAYLRRLGNYKRPRKLRKSAEIAATKAADNAEPKTSSEAKAEPAPRALTKPIGTPAALREARNNDLDLDDYLE